MRLRFVGPSHIATTATAWKDDNRSYDGISSSSVSTRYLRPSPFCASTISTSNRRTSGFMKTTLKNLKNKSVEISALTTLLCALALISANGQSKRRRDRERRVTHATDPYAKRAMNTSFARGINGHQKLKMETQIYSSISAGWFAPNPEQIREAAADLYDACKFVLDPNRSGYSLFSHRATIILEAAVAKAEGRSHCTRTTSILRTIPDNGQRLATATG